MAISGDFRVSAALRPYPFTPIRNYVHRSKRLCARNPIHNTKAFMSMEFHLQYQRWWLHLVARFLFKAEVECLGQGLMELILMSQIVVLINGSAKHVFLRPLVRYSLS